MNNHNIYGLRNSVDDSDGGTKAYIKPLFGYTMQMTGSSLSGRSFRDINNNNIPLRFLLKVYIYKIEMYFSGNDSNKILLLIIQKTGYTSPENYEFTSKRNVN